MERLCIVAMVSCATLGCQDEFVSAQTARVRQNLVESDNETILGFDDVSHWTSAQAQPMSADSGHAVSVAIEGWTEVESAQLSSLESIGQTASLKVRLGQQVNWGELRLVLTAPSLGLTWADLGAHSLSALGSGEYRTLQFALGSHQEALAGDYQDLRVHIIVNGPNATVTLEDLSFDTPQASESSPVAFSVELPGTAPASDVVLGARAALRVNDGVELLSHGRSRPLLVNMGETETNIGVDTKIGSLCSRASPFLRERAKVYGFIETSGVLDTQNGTEISGEQLQSAPIALTRATWDIAFSEALLPSVEVLGSTPLPPGEYGRVQVFPGGRLDLTSGVYKFRELLIEPNANVVVDTSVASTKLYVRDSLIYRGLLTDTGLARWGTQVLIGYAGTSPLHIEAPLRATIVAPNAWVNLASLNGTGTHIGAVFASSIEAHQNTTIVNSPSTRAIQQAQDINFDDSASLSIDPTFVDVGVAESELSGQLLRGGIPNDRTRNGSSFDVIALERIRDIAIAGDWPLPGTEANPVRVFRDNPTFFGDFTWHLGEGASADGKYSHLFQWFGGTGGELVLTEHSYGWASSSSYPLLPIQGEQSSDTSEVAQWWLRGGKLIPENRYLAQYSVVQHNDGDFQPETSTWLELDHQVLVVPVVAVTFIDTRDEFGSVESQDWSHRARALFDFIPPTQQEPPSQLDPDGYTRAADALVDPTLEDTQGAEIPPDEIYAQCGVQFQLLYTFTFELPPGFNYNANGGVYPNGDPCDPGKAPVWYNPADIRAMISAELPPEIADALNALGPVLAAYGDMECSLFSGKAIKEARFIQVDTRRSASHMTSHELSHVLLDQDGHSSVSGNLINFGPDVGDKELTPSQCQQIRDNIINLYRFPEALREYNLTIGRSQPAPTPPPVFDATVEFPRSAVSATRQYTCCEVDGVVRSTMPIACDPGSAHPKKDCEVCCVTAVSGTSFGHSLVPPTECTGLITSIEECALVCCGKGQPAARAVCVAEGRTIESDVAADCQDIF